MKKLLGGNIRRYAVEHKLYVVRSAELCSAKKAAAGGFHGHEAEVYKPEKTGRREKPRENSPRVCQDSMSLR